MRATGIVRRVDDLGRVVIPKELRKTLNIDIKDSMEIFVNGDQIILKKYQPSCIFCENVENVTDIQGKNICAECLAKISNINK